LETGEISTNKMRDPQTKDFLFVHPASSATRAPANDSPTDKSELNGGTV
jgi:hypothetical protein